MPDYAGLRSVLPDKLDSLGKSNLVVGEGRSQETCVYVQAESAMQAILSTNHADMCITVCQACQSDEVTIRDKQARKCAADLSRRLWRELQALLEVLQGVVILAHGCPGLATPHPCIPIRRHLRNCHAEVLHSTLQRRSHLSECRKPSLLA